MRYLSIVFILLFSIELFAKPVNGLYLEVGASKELEDKLEMKSAADYVYEKSYMLDGIVGFQYSLYRIEFEYSQRSAELYSQGSSAADGDITQISKMINIYYSGYNHSRFISSIGIGAGLSDIEVDDTNSAALKNDSIQTAQAMYTIGYMISDNFIFTTKYKYMYIKESDDFKKRDNNIFSFSFRYIF